MKISFEDNSYIESIKTTNKTVILKIGARSASDRLSMIVNSVELNDAQIKTLIKEIQEDIQ